MRRLWLVGSNPTEGTTATYRIWFALWAAVFTKDRTEVIWGLESKPANTKQHGMWRSLVAHLLWEQGVAGSNPAIPTIQVQKTKSALVLRVTTRG